MSDGGVDRVVENPYVEYGKTTLFCAETGHPVAPISNDTSDIDGELPRSDPYQRVWGAKAGATADGSLEDLNQREVNHARNE